MTLLCWLIVIAAVISIAITVVLWAASDMSGREAETDENLQEQ